MIRDALEAGAVEPGRDHGVSAGCVYNFDTSLVDGEAIWLFESSIRRVDEAI